MSFKKIDQPKVVQKIGEITIEYVKLEGEDKPTVMLKNEGKLSSEMVKELLATALMIITQFDRDRLNDN
jgi:hypothetical protein